MKSKTDRQLLERSQRHLTHYSTDNKEVEISMQICFDNEQYHKRSSADADKPARRVYRSVKVIKH